MLCRLHPGVLSTMRPPPDVSPGIFYRGRSQPLLIFHGRDVFTQRLRTNTE